ncbi:DUF2095 domain-containing protein, partial [bacterium]
MDVEKKRFRRMFPSLAQELERENCGTQINSVRPDPTTGEKAVLRRFTDYTQDVIDYVRRCNKAEKAEEIIGYLEKRRE